jgi:hypothetical protein
MSTHPLLAPQSDIVERVAAVIPNPAASEHVPDWPVDEVEFFREGFDTWRSFREREEMLGRIRRIKVAHAVLSVLGVEQ